MEEVGRAYLRHELVHPGERLLARGVVGGPHAEQRAHAHVVQAVARIVVVALVDDPFGQFLDGRSAQRRLPERAFALLPAASTRPRPRIASSAAPAPSRARSRAPATPTDRARAPPPAPPPPQPPIRSPILHAKSGEQRTFLLQLLDFGGQSLDVRVVLLLVLRSTPRRAPTDTLNSTRTLTSSSESSWFAASMLWIDDPARHSAPQAPRSDDSSSFRSCRRRSFSSVSSAACFLCSSSLAF